MKIGNKGSEDYSFTTGSDSNKVGKGKQNSKSNKLTNFVKGLFGKDKEEKTETQIIHLGGTKLATHDPQSKQTKRTAEYFYENIPLTKKNDKQQFFVDSTVQEKYVKEYMRDLKAGKTDATFQGYMEKRIHREDSVASEIEKARVRYFNDDERKQTEVVLKGGKLQQIGLNSGTNRLKALPEGVYAFVLVDQSDPKTGAITQKLYATPKMQTEDGTIRHSSFTRSGNVISAGAIEMGKNGELLGISNWSGHYKPTVQHLELLVDHLKAANVDTSNVQIIERK